MEVHEDIEKIQWQPRDEEHHGNAEDHDVCSATFFIVFCMLALNLIIIIGKSLFHAFNRQRFCNGVKKSAFYRTIVPERSTNE